MPRRPGSLPDRLRGALRAALGPLLRRLESRLPPAWACRIRNAKMRARGLPERFAHHPELALYSVRDAGQIHYFAHRERGFGLYARGLRARARQIAASYLLDRLEFRRQDTVIDCGANYADLYLYLRGRIDERNYFTFEPGADEHRAIRHNAPQGQHAPLGLGDRCGERVFYLDSPNADSSFIRPRHYTATRTVGITTLDQFVADTGLQRVRLLKLEAEGFEPEILRGAAHALSICEYLAIDGGFERGEACEETLSTQLQLLLAAGYELLGMTPRPLRALLRNTAFAHDAGAAPAVEGR